MYLISIAAVIIVSAFMIGITNGGIIYLIDLPSIIALLLVAIPMLIGSGLFKDFNNAFVLVMKPKKNVQLKEVKRAIEAVELVMKCLLYTGVFVALISIIVIMHDFTEMEYIGPNLAVAVLTMIYSLFINLILLPVKVKLKTMMIDMLS